MLDGRRAATNKVAFDWGARQSDKVAWQPRARWVVDDRYMTASGVSAGTDMAPALYDRATAKETARSAKYVWNEDPDEDSFAIDWTAPERRA